MSYTRHDGEVGGEGERDAGAAIAPGRRTLTMGLAPVVQRAAAPRVASAPVAATLPLPDPFGLHLPAVQRRLAAVEPDGAPVRGAAQAGVASGGGPLPHGDVIQRSFGPRHELAGVTAHVGGDAAAASEAMGAEAYATGTRIGFRAAPDLHLAAHEAAHVIQQRGGVQLKGGVGAAGDAHERHADAVADRVVAGASAADLLDQYGGGGGGATIQRKLRDARTQAEITDYDLDHLDRETATMIDQQIRQGAWTADPEDLEKIRRALAAPQASSSGMELGVSLDAPIGTGHRVANAMTELEQRNPTTETTRGAPTSGVWYRGDYQRAAGEIPHEYRNGWANPKFFKMPPAGRDLLVLLPGASASAAVDAYFEGLTITECFSMVLATSYRALRDEWGAMKFDATFGGVEREVERPLCIEGAATFSAKNPISRYLGKSPAALNKHERGTKDRRPVEIGDFASFANHPDYSFKHPSGSAAFWNVVCVDATLGAQRWSGFGLGTAQSEDQIIELLMREYNKEPSEEPKGEFADPIVDAGLFQTGKAVKGATSSGVMGFQPGDSKRLQATPVADELKLVGEQSKMGMALASAAQRHDDKQEQRDKERRRREFMGESATGSSRDLDSVAPRKPVSIDSLRSFSTAGLRMPKPKPTSTPTPTMPRESVPEGNEAEVALPPREVAHETTARTLGETVGPALAAAVLSAELGVPFEACGHTWVLLGRERAAEANDDCACTIKRLT